MHSRQPSLSTIEADENSSNSSFDDLVRSFNHKVAELQQLVSVRLSDDCKNLFTRDITGLEASVRAVEGVYMRVQEHLDREMASMSKAASLVASFQQQAAHCQHISQHLPAHLPGNAAAAAGAGSMLAGSSTSATAAAGGVAGSSRAAPAAGAADAAAGGSRRPLQPIQPAAAPPAGGKQAVAGGAPRDQSKAKQGAGAGAAGPAAAGGGGGAGGVGLPLVAPRWFITAGELAGLSSYIRGRATLTKVNTVIEEVAGVAEANARLMAAQRSGAPGALPAAERRRAADLYFNVASREGVRGCCWFLDADLSRGVALKRDKSGAALLQLLRHLGRLKEVRVNLETLGPTVVYVLQRPPS